MATIPCRTIIKQYETWHSGYNENDARGRDNIKFVLAGEQWDGAVVGSRVADDKEMLTLNQCLKLSRRLKAQGRELDFSINVAPINPKIEEDAEQLNVYKMLLNSIALSDKLTKTLARCYYQCVDYGYSFLEVNYDFENDQTLNTIPVVRLHRDPSIAFWDRSATDPNKIKGRFCGLHRSLSKEEFLSKYPKYSKDSDWLKSKGNIFIDYWYRKYKTVKYILLMTGSYKQEDLIKPPQDKIAIEPPDKKTPLIKTNQICEIFHLRYLNKKLIQPPESFPIDDLPLIYHPACTVEIPESGDETYPLIYHLKDAQKLHNYIMSQIATIAKNSSADKWIFSADHVMTETQEKNATNINTQEGGFVFGGNISHIRREQPAELPMSMLNMGQITKSSIEELAGAMGDTQSSEQTVVSGVALDRITRNIGLVNVDSIAVHIEFINVLSQLLRQMIPRIYTEERTLIVKKKDGTGKAIIINQLNKTTGEVTNNIKDLNNEFEYEITASPSSAMEKDNTLKALALVYAIDPQAWQQTGDIYMRNLSTEDAPELERRIAPNIDPNLIKYSQGELTLEEYMKQKEETRQGQMKEQVQLMMIQPQFQSMMKEAAAHEVEAQAEQAKAQAAQSKAETAQFDAETKRMKVTGDLENDSAGQHIKAVQMISQDERSDAQHTIDQERLKNHPSALPKE